MLTLSRTAAIGDFIRTSIDNMEHRRYVPIANNNSNNNRFVVINHPNRLGTTRTSHSAKLIIVYVGL